MPSTTRLVKNDAVLVAVALLSRLVYLAILVYSEPQRASQHFLYGGETGSIAASIASGHGFSSPLSAPSGPTAWMTPVFPYLLAFVFKIFGVFTMRSNLAIKILDILFSSLTVLPILAITRRLFGETTATLSGWMWAFLPAGIYFPAVWVWDMSLAALILMVALWFSYRSMTATVSQTASLLLGVLWGFAILVNAAILSVCVPTLAYSVYQRKKIGLAWIRPAILCAAGFAATLAPWIVRNQLVFHGAVTLRSNFGLELWLGNNPQVPDTWTWWLHPTGSRQEYEKFFRMGEVAYMAEKKSLAVDFMKSHPLQTAKFQLHRFLETWTGNSDSFVDIWETGSPSLRAELLFNYALTLLMLCGMFLAYRTEATGSLPLIFAIAFFPIPYYLCHTTPRYRHPIDPIVVIFAACACVRFANAATAMWRRSPTGPPRRNSIPA